MKKRKASRTYHPVSIEVFKMTTRPDAAGTFTFGIRVRSHVLGSYIYARTAAAARRTFENYLIEGGAQLDTEIDACDWGD